MSARILIVEDNRDNMTLMDYLLTAGGYVASLASSGARGLVAAAEVPPDLVLLDIQMPEMDGYEVAAALREQPASEDAIIVAVTAFAMVGDQDRIIGAGFDGYVTKPISPETFVREIEEFIPAELRVSAAGPRRVRP